MGFTFCKLEAEAIRQHTGAAGSFFTLKRYKKSCRKNFAAAHCTADTLPLFQFKLVDLAAFAVNNGDFQNSAGLFHSYHPVGITGQYRERP